MQLNWMGGRDAGKAREVQNDDNNIILLVLCLGFGFGLDRVALKK